MLSLFSILLLGLFLGMRHATDADHVIAVTTIVSRERGIFRSAMIGALWGIGHTITILAVGAAIILFGLVIPQRLGMSMELTVGLMLVLLGLWNLNVFHRWFRKTQHLSNSETQIRKERRHDHASGHGHDSWIKGTFVVRSSRPLLVGIVHGLAGSAAVTLLVLPIIHDPFWAVAYLGVFGAGTIIGMMLITAAIAWPFSFSAMQSAVLHRRLGVATGVLSVCFGAFMIYEIGFQQGLFLK